MKTSIILILGIFYFLANSLQAQIDKVPKLPPMYLGVSGYFNEIKNKLKKIENIRTENIQLQIQVMSPGNDPADTNVDYWFASFGTTSLNVDRSVPNIISFSKSNQVIYWFNDRTWNEVSFRKQFYSDCCAITRVPFTDTPDLRSCSVGGYHPFSTEGIEKGILTLQGSKMNLFEEWGWQVKTTYKVGSILYGELSNGHTFSLSYRFSPNLQVN
jgi:hypothetical protein